MNYLSDYLKEKILKSLFTEATFLSCSHLSIGLWCSPIVDSNGFFQPQGEVKEQSYSRCIIPYEPGVFSEVTGNYVKNEISLIFPESVESWGVITHVGFFERDGDEDGELIMHCKLQVSREVTSGDTVHFPPSSLRIRYG
jgi:hypothetical protein